MLIFISCVKSKIKTNKEIEAWKLYSKSSLFNKSLAYARTLVSDEDIYIISAKYGAIKPYTKISYYEKTLNTFKKNELIEFQLKVESQLPTLLKTNQRVVSLMGSKYNFAIQNIPKNKLETPLNNLSFGKRLKKLNQLL